MPEQAEVKTEDEDIVATSKPSISSQAAPNKSCRQKSSSPLPPESVGTSARLRKQSAGSNTPLIHLVIGDDDDVGMMPPPSALDSSPTARQTRIQAGRAAQPSDRFGLRTATGLRHVRRTKVKQEGEESLVWTPGGTLRRCGQNGFACGRPFCFTCTVRRRYDFSTGSGLHPR